MGAFIVSYLNVLFLELCHLPISKNSKQNILQIRVIINLNCFQKKFPYSIIIPSLDKHTFAKILSSILTHLDITRKMNKNFSFLYVLH